jgi:hypothetical protein
LVVLPNLRVLGPFNAGSYSVYHAAGRWIAQHASPAERILDLTDWSLYFSQRPGARFADIYDAGGDPNLRWILARQPQVEGHGHYSRVLRNLIAERAPVALIPPDAGTNQVQVRVYDRRAATAWATSSIDVGSSGRQIRRR